MTVNNLYVKTARGWALSPEAAAWKNLTIVLVRQAFIDARRPLLLPDGKLSFTLRYWPPRDGRKHDPSNLLKLAEDSLFAAFMVDDDRLWSSQAIRQDRSVDPHLIVSIEPFRDSSLVPARPPTIPPPTSSFRTSFEARKKEVTFRRRGFA